MTDSNYIFEANATNFDELVIQKSQDTLVLVDFWADWCQPCQMLMPVLAKMAEEAQGGFILVKVNSDENQELATQYGVRSLPTVKFFKGGQVVDEFMGVQPEPVIQQLINKNRVRQGEAKYQQALSLKANDSATAESLLREVLEAEPDYYEAALELAEVLTSQNKLEEAQKILDSIKPEQVDKAQLESLKKQIQRAQLKAQAGDIDALEQAVIEQPDDLQAKLDLAKAKVLGDQVQEGLDLYLEVMKQDRNFGDDAARKGLLQAFELFDKNDPMIKEYRAKLYSLLY